MKLRELKHGPIHAWLPMFGGAYRPGDRFPVGEVGGLRDIDTAKGVPGLHLEIEYDGRTWSGLMQWDGAEESRDTVRDILRRYTGSRRRALRLFRSVSAAQLGGTRSRGPLDESGSKPRDCLGELPVSARQTPTRSPCWWNAGYWLRRGVHPDRAG